MKSKLLKYILIPVTIAGIIGLAAGIFFYCSVDFDPAMLSKDASSGRGTVFLDRHGSELRFLPDMKGERARWMPLAEIPENVRNAFIAAEDERFYRHHGFDVAAIMRAAWSNIIKRKIVSGASTISQQVIRLVYSGDTETDSSANAGRQDRKRKYKDKLVEIVRSIKMEHVFAKEAILEQYLNRVPMGNNLCGIETAARAYFGKSSKNLSTSEAALLASLPKAPGLLNPYGDNKGRLLERRNWALQRMERLGLISHEQHVLANEERPHLARLNFVNRAPHLIDQFTRQRLPGGTVRTTVDLDLQTTVQDILRSHKERLANRSAHQAAAIVIHNPSMEVLAAVGSLEYSQANDGFNNGVKAARSAGSTLKPFLYALALELGNTATTLLEDTERTYRSREGQYAPYNFDRKEYGPVTMRTALGSSLNLSAVRMLDRLGEEQFYEILLRLNLISHPEKGPEHYGLGMAIGNPEVSPEQLAAAYAALANQGVYRPVKYVMTGQEPETGSRGKKGSNRKEEEKRYILLPQTAYIITDMLADPTARMLTFGRSRNMDFPFRVAVKTGTSTFFRDLWAVGYSTDYTVAVWVGNFDGSATNKLSGASAAAPILSDILGYLYRQSTPIPFKRPKGISRMTVCGYSGMKPSRHCTHTVEELFIAGTEPQETCTFHTANMKRHELATPYAGWLYDKNRGGGAGRYRLSGFADDLTKVFQDPWAGVASDPRGPAVRVKNAKIANMDAPAEHMDLQPVAAHFTIKKDGTSVAASPAAVDGAPIRIIYPLDRDRFVRDKYGDNQVIKLQAVVEEAVSYVDWFVNGTLYKRTSPPYQAYWPLEPGSYRITVVTPANRGDSIQVSVE